VDEKITGESLNFDATTCGTFAEIGGGQDVPQAQRGIMRGENPDGAPWGK
jgi:hypothetical protein